MNSFRTRMTRRSLARTSASWGPWENVAGPSGSGATSAISTGGRKNASAASINVSGSWTATNQTWTREGSRDNVSGSRDRAFRRRTTFFSESFSSRPRSQAEAFAASNPQMLAQWRIELSERSISIRASLESSNEAMPSIFL